MTAPEAPKSIAALFQDWKAARDAVNASGGDDAALIDQQGQIEAALMALPAKTPADLAKQLYAFGSGDVLFICEASKPLAAQIERLTGEPCK
jgi:hypothetical protein